jgi:DNA-binding response OmpR family regulator|tara:strand:+ start:575 stop:952 length:378 start_codon:yes stop_codon:yes gene_type:complete
MSSKILVVDDEAEVVLRLKNMLTAKGYSVVTAFDGKQGLDMALAEKPDLILLDIVMPKKDGFKVLGEIRLSEITKDIPVILLSAKSQTDFLFEGKRLMATDYLIKPIEVEKLLKYIRRYLSLTQA